MRTTFVSAAILFSILISQPIFSQIPKIISYQGILTDTAGIAKPDGIYNFTFRLYDSNSGGSAFWNESKKLNVKKGVFATNLGDQTPFGDNIKFDKPYWLSIQIESDAELFPRFALTSVGYSINSINSDSAGFAKNSDTANFAKQFKIDNGQVVRSINGLKDNITLKGSGGAAVTTNGDTITIAASGGGSGGGISAIQNTDNTLSISNPNGPTTTINLHSPFIINSDVGIGVNSPAAKLDVNGGSGSGANIGIHGSSNDNYGIYGTSNNNYGLFGESAGWIGVYARTYATGTYALLAGNGLGNKNYCGLASGSYSIFANGPVALSTVGIGAEPDQNPSGIKLNINSGNGIGINVQSNNNGIYSIASGSTYSGIKGENSASGYGVSGISASGTGVYASTNSSNGTGIFAINTSIGSYGVIGGWTNSNPNLAYRFGVYGNPGTGSDDARWVGVYGKANSSNQRAGLFDGSVDVLGNLGVAGSKFFKIDDPIDPANKYLFHACIESSERLNVYCGNVITDGNGFAIINLPPYFEALNIDYRYQLTVIGQFAQAIIEKEINNNQFTIQTDKPNIKISWMVTGKRNDAYAKAYPMVVEQEKSPNERGKYLKPELYGQPKENGIYYFKPPEITVKDKE